MADLVDNPTKAHALEESHVLKDTLDNPTANGLAVSSIAFAVLTMHALLSARVDLPHG